MTAELPTAEPVRGERAEAARVVLVDDETLVCETLKDVLEDADYHVEVAGDAPGALALLERLDGACDCVLLDIRLTPVAPTTGQIDGIDILRSTKARWPDVGVIVITAYASVDNAVAALNLGADAYLRKPVNPEEMLAMVLKTVDRRELAREKAHLEIQAREQNRFLLEKNSELAAANRRLQEALRQLRQAQARLIQSEKLASLGQLVAGVAHELNNPISFVYSNMARLLDYVRDIRRLFAAYREVLAGLRRGQPPGEMELRELARLEAEADIAFVLDDLRDLARESREGAERVQSVVLDLRNFSRMDEGEVQNVDLVKGIESTLNLLRPELKHRIKVELALEPLPPVRGNTAQLNQVVLNLVLNAAQAITGEGTIHISTEATDAGVRFAVSDTGRGIPAENLGKIFDPFFTTRKDRPGKGAGTGLGLAIAHSIVENHQGTVSVDSTPGRGATFTVELPLMGYQPKPTDSAELPLPPPQTEATGGPTGEETDQ